MPDTGAPWNIPYVAGTDLVRDWPTDSQDLAEAIADGLDAAGNAGIGTNVVQTVKTDTFSTSSTSFTTVTGLTASITPTAASSKVLIIAQISHALNESNATTNRNVGHFKVTRGGTDIYIGDAASNRVRAVFGGFIEVTGLKYYVLSESIVFLDSPATTSSTTYQVEVQAVDSGTVHINRDEENADSANEVRGASSITVIEVAA